MRVLRSHSPSLKLRLRRSVPNPSIIPGHGQPVSNRSALRDFRDMLVGVRANIVALKKNRYSLDAIVAAKPTAAYDAKWGNFVINPALFTKLVCEGT